MDGVACTNYRISMHVCRRRVVVPVATWLGRDDFLTVAGLVSLVSGPPELRVSGVVRDHTVIDGVVRVRMYSPWLPVSRRDGGVVDAFLCVPLEPRDS